MTTRQSLFPRRQTHPVADEHAVLNWAQNATLAQERAVITPETEAQLQQAIASCQGRVRIMGSRMSPGRMLAITQPQDILIDLSRLRGLLAVSDDSVTFAGGTPLHEVYEVLTAMNRMLHASPG